MTPAGDVQEFALSPDEQFLALGLGEVNEEGQVWLRALPGAASIPFTVGSAPGWSRPAWSPDGNDIAYTTFSLMGLSEYSIRRKPRDQSKNEETIRSGGADLGLRQWSRNGILFEDGSEETDLLLLEDGQEEPVVVAGGSGNQSQGQFLTRRQVVGLRFRRERRNGGLCARIPEHRDTDSDLGRRE